MKVIKSYSDFDDSYESLLELGERIGMVKQKVGISDSKFAQFESKFYPKKEILAKDKAFGMTNLVVLCVCLILN